MLIYKTTKKLDLYSKEDIEFIENLSEKTTKERLLNLIYELSELANQMKVSTQKNIIFQTGIIKACMELEYQNLQPVEVKSQKNRVKEVNIQNKTNKEEQKPKQEAQKEEKSEPVKIKTTNGEYVTYWQNVLDKIKQSGKMTVYANLIGTKGVLINDLVVGIEFPGKVTEFARKVIEEHENKAMIEKIISMEQGSPMQIKILDKTEEKKAAAKKPEIENIADEMDIPFNVIDE